MTAKKKKDEFVIDPDKIPEKLLVNNAPLGAGRTPKALQLKKYEYALKRLDDNTEKIFDVLENLLDDPDPNIRMRVAELFLKKIIPDKKIKEVVGAGGGPVQITQQIDVRALVLDAVGALDSLDIDTIRRRAQDGNFRIIDPDTGTES